MNKNSICYQLFFQLQPRDEQLQAKTIAVNKKLAPMMLLNSIAHPSEVNNGCTGIVTKMVVKLRFVDMRANVITDVSAVVMLGVGAATLPGFEIIVETAVAIGWEFIVKVGACALEVLTDEWGEVITSGAPGIDAEVNASGWTATTTALEFVVLAPSSEPSFLCC